MACNNLPYTAKSGPLLAAGVVSPAFSAMGSPQDGSPGDENAPSEGLDATPFKGARDLEHDLERQVVQSAPPCSPVRPSYSPLTALHIIRDEGPYATKSPTRPGPCWR